MITAMPRIAIAVTDFSTVTATFKETLGMPLVDLTPGSVETLGAKLAMCVPQGGCNIEIMSPGNPQTPLSQSIERFLDRRGQGHFAMMFEAADPDAEAEDLLARGLNVLPRMEGAGGRDVHPNSTHGVLIRVYPIDSFVGADPNHGPDHETGKNPPGLTGVGRVIIAVRDLSDATATYGEKFALPVTAPQHDEARGVHTAICTPPKGGLIELVAAENPEKPFASAIDSFLATRGEGLYALILQTDDLDRTRKALAKRGLDAKEVDGRADTLELDPARMFGARFWIEKA